MGGRLTRPDDRPRRAPSDHRQQTAVLDAATRSNAFWAPREDRGLKAGAPVRESPFAGGEAYSGNAAEEFVAAAPLAFFAVPAD